MNEIKRNRMVENKIIEKERETVCVCMREKESVCVCVCMRERES